MNGILIGISIYAMGVTGITPGSTVGFQAPQLACVKSMYEIACPSNLQAIPADKHRIGAKAEKSAQR